MVKQFNWRKHWRKKVSPHLQDKEVQFMLDSGLKGCNPFHESGDPPCYSGRDSGNRIMKGKLSWYQPIGRCHYIAPFACVIGQRIFPELRWRILTSHRHSVPIGYRSGEY